MSHPISNCLQAKAVVDEEAHKELMRIHKSNHIHGGHYTTFGCSHTPNCFVKYNITQEMLDEYNKKLDIEWKQFMEEHDKEQCLVCGYKGQEGTPGDKC